MSSVTPPYVGLTDTPLRQSLATTTSISHSKQSRSSWIMQNVYADTLATAQEESWTNTNAWFPTTGAQVSGGYAYAPTTANIQPMTRTGVTVNTGQTARLECLIKVVTNSNSNYTMVGFSNDVSGTTPATGLSSKVVAAIGIFNNTVVWTNAGSTHVLTTGGATIANGTYKVCIEIDETYVGCTLSDLAGANVWYQYVTRRGSFSAATPFIPWVLLEDSNELTGSGIGLLSIKLGPASSRKAFGLASQAPTIVFSQVPRLIDGVLSANSGAQVMVITPPGYDSRIPYPAVLCFHSAGGSLNDYLTANQKTPITQALLAAGYILILACSFDFTNATWGNQYALDTYTSAYQYARDHFNIGTMTFLATSMGGIESLLSLAERSIPDVVAWVGVSPTYNQISCLNQNTITGTFYPGMAISFNATQDIIGAAVGTGATSISTTSSYSAGMKLSLDVAFNSTSPEVVSVTGNSTGTGPYITPISPTKFAHASGATCTNFPSQLIGNNAIGSQSPNGLPIHDPAQLPPSAFRGVPMFIFTASDDTTVPPTLNGVALASVSAGVSTEVLFYPGITGNHTFIPTADMVTSIIRFFNKYTGH